MILKEAIHYLENESIDASIRFMVLTGYNSAENIKDHDSNYWVKALYNTIAAIEKEKASSFGGFFSAVGSSLTGSDLRSRLSTVYKIAIEPCNEQFDYQEEYVQIALNYLKENRNNKKLLEFKFADPNDLFNKYDEVKPIAFM